jgi:hypothetical protein
MGKRGNPGYGKLTVIREQFEAIQMEWWDEMRKFLHSKSKVDRKFALQELNKVQVKLIPTEVTGAEGGPLQVKWLSPSLTVPADGLNPSTTHSPAG